jgi:hypothetical protein
MNDRTGCSLLIIAAAVGATACSAGQTRPPAQPAAGTPAASTSVAAPAAIPDPATAGPKVPAGYRIERHGGTELYCKSFVLLGSRFPEKKCLTREQIEDLEGDTESAMGEIERRIPICGGAGSCPSG